MNSILIFTYPLGILLVLALVVGQGVYLTRKFNLGWRLFWIGGALFIISQVLHIPFNALVLNRIFNSGFIPVPPEEYHLIFNAVVLGLSAGLFEELTRYTGLCWWAKDARSWSKGLLFGAGWGGIEATIWILIMLLNYTIFMVLRTADLSTLLPPEQMIPLQQGLDLFWGVAWYDSLLGAVERILTLPIQLALTILVLQVFLRRQSRWLWLAIGWHTLVNAVAVFSLGQWGAYIAEGTVVVFSLLSIAMIFLLRTEEPADETRRARRRS